MDVDLDTIFVIPNRLFDEASLRVFEESGGQTDGTYPVAKLKGIAEVSMLHAVQCTTFKRTVKNNKAKLN